MGRLSNWTLLGLMLLTITALHDVRADAPSENECRPFIEKALHELKVGETPEDDAEVIIVDDGSSGEDPNDPNDDDDDDSKEIDDAISAQVEGDDADDSGEDDATVTDGSEADDGKSDEEDNKSGEDSSENTEVDDGEDDQSAEEDEATRSKRSVEDGADNDSKAEADDAESGEDDDAKETESEKSDEDAKTDADEDDSKEDDGVDSKEDDGADSKETEDDDDDEASSEEPKTDDDDNDNGNKSEETTDVAGDDDSKEDETASDEKEVDSDDGNEDSTEEKDDNKSGEDDDADADDSTEDTEVVREKRDVSDDDDSKEDADTEDDKDDEAASAEEDDAPETKEANDLESEEDEKKEDEIDSNEDNGDSTTESDEASDDSVEETSQVTKPIESFPEDDLLMEFVVPTNLRDHSHVTELLRLDEEFDEKEAAINKAAEGVLKQLKTIYENAIKPLETLYKYRDLSNRHFGDPEIFSKPLVLFMGPWSGGKSTILNYLTENEHTADSIRTGAEPSPAYFNILMHGEKPEVLDGTQLAADWTFSGLQKFGQGLEERLRGQKLPHKLLEKVNIVEIPGILEVRKTVNRMFPFNDACQWFIDRADIIFLVYDPSKLDVGPETEAILDQLKGREYQTRILLNKADQVKPEELLRVQGALIWNISPLMSSAQPPVMYTTSLWSHPYEEGAPVRLLQAQERSFLRDLRAAMDKRIDNKIASARRFAVRVRNHAKMVDCYLTTYYNHKTLFGNKKQIADNIIENPSNYHIYEGLSTLTNISRYDLPDPDVYKDFFRLNKLYEFKKLSETCTYFRGCPINKLDVAIAYDLPELVGKYKKSVESALISIEKTQSGGKR